MLRGYVSLAQQKGSMVWRKLSQHRIPLYFGKYIWYTIVVLSVIYLYGLMVIDNENARLGADASATKHVIKMSPTHKIRDVTDNKGESGSMIKDLKLDVADSGSPLQIDDLRDHDEQLQPTERLATNRPWNLGADMADADKYEEERAAAAERLAGWKTEQEQRRRRLQRVCSQQKKTPDALVSAITRHMLVEELHQVVYCRIPKVASTSWTLSLAALQSGMTPNKVMEEKLQKNYRLHYAPHLANYGVKDLMTKSPVVAANIQKTFSKFLFVRHPFQRLVSAYKDKFMSPWPLEKLFIDINTYILKKYRRPPAGQVQSARSGNATFVEYLRYVLEDRKNTHWALAVDLCRPCDTNFDYIGKLETFSQDTKYILKFLFGIEDEEFLQLTNPTSLDNANSETYHYSYPTHFQNVPSSLIKSLYEAYRVDFETFGYTLTDMPPDH